MTLITGFFNALAAIPSLIGAVEKLVLWISNQIDQAKKRKISKELADAIKEKDTDAIDAIFDPRKKK